MIERNCNICVWKRSGSCSRWDCSGTLTESDVEKLIEKETEKEPVLVNGYPDKFHICPKCASTFINRDGVTLSYCGNCGQKLKKF